MSFFGRSEPSVPLSFHDAMIAAMRLDLSDQQKRYDRLLEQFTALRVAGAVVEPKPEAVRSAAPAEEPDELKALIHAKAPDVRSRRMMLQQLSLDRAAGVDDDKIRQSILDGVQPDGVPG